MKRILIAAASALSLAAFALPAASGAQAASGPGYGRPFCEQNAVTCTELNQYISGYTGHDEPSVLFYSSKPGSGNNDTYAMTLPTDPPKLPRQDGSGGTFNFQLHPAFWFGMAMCDDQSAPNPGGSSLGATVPCTPDSDSNIYTSTDPSSSHYIGLHPGTAFMEMQFYPPGWVSWPAGNSCSATRWCAALNIDSLSQNMNTGQSLNPTCAEITGQEYVNFAFITKSGVSQAPANPVQSTAATFTPNPSKDLFMHSGDRMITTMRDTHERVPGRDQGPDHRPDRLDDGERRERVRRGAVRADRHVVHQHPDQLPSRVLDLQRGHPRSVGRALLQRGVLR